MKAHGPLWLVNPFPTSGAHVGYTRRPRLRVVLRRDHLTYERCATMGPAREEVLDWASLHFQKCSWPLSKHIPIPKHNQPFMGRAVLSNRWRLIPLHSGTLSACMSSIAHVGETPKRLLEKEGLLHSAWLCPPRCCNQLLWVKMECKSCSARLPGAWGEWSPLPASSRREIERIYMFFSLSPSRNLQTFGNLESCRMWEQWTSDT